MRFLKILALGVLSLALSPAASAQFTVPGFELVYSYPAETSLENSDIRSPEQVWCEMFNDAKKRIDLTQMYISTDPSGDALNSAIACLEAAGKRGVKIRFVVEKGMEGASNAEGIARIKAIPNLELQAIEWKKINGDGIIHAKYIIVDGHTAFMGSQNFDWRALKHIHETGVKIEDESIVAQMQKIFDFDWRAWKAVNRGKPWKDIFPLQAAQSVRPVAAVDRRAYLVASPWKWNPHGIGDSESELVRLMGTAKERIQVVVMDYAPVDFHRVFYPVIDDAIRAAAQRGVKVQLAIANWSTEPGKIEYIKSLSLLPNIEIRVVTLPEAKGGFIPFARVVHSKFMVVDGKTTWLGTSNWTGGYLDQSRNLELVVKDDAFAGRLAKMQEQLFTSAYAVAVDVNKNYPRPRKGK